MKNFLEFYRELNKLQAAAVDAIEGPVLVLAGPGTGKTQLLSVRAGAIISKKNVAPEDILILTYTNAAAKAMKERLGRIIGPPGYDLEVGTFHSFANSIIQESEEAANYAGDKIQMDEVEQVKAIEYILDNVSGLDEIRPFRAPYTYLREILKKISDLKKDGVTADELHNYIKSNPDAKIYPDEKHLRRLVALATVYGIYEKLKEGKTAAAIFDERGRYDFDDMILYAKESLRLEAALRERYKERFKYVMVDEYQDTNGAQLELLFTFLDYDNPNLLCVGDDDQSIYRFQGASVGNFKLLKERFPKLTILSLKNNYRSSQELIEISNKVINLIPLEERMGEKALEPVREYSHKEIDFKEFTAPQEELIYIVDKIKELKDKIERSPDLTKDEKAHPFNNIAILVRKRNDILKVIDALLQAGIPYATDGKEDISGEKRVRQLLDILELAYASPGDPEASDLVLYKVLTADYLEIPLVDALKFIRYANDAKRAEEIACSKTLLEGFLTYFLSPKNDDIEFENRDKLIRAAHAIRELLNDAGASPVHSLLIRFIKNSGIFRFILREYDVNKILKTRELRALASFVNMVKSAGLARPGLRLDEFMSEMNMRKHHDLPIQGSLVTMTQDGVRILTAHGSKGAEFQVVMIPFCLQNKNWPMRRWPEMIPLPVDLFKAKEKIREKQSLKNLYAQDETRLFYVAMTRAKSNLIFTSSPTEDSISSYYLSGLDLKRELDQGIEEDLLVKSLELTDLKDPFIGTEAILKDMVSGLSLNPTRVNNYIFCRRKFLYNDILKLPGPKKKGLVFGNCVHKALEDLYRRYQKEEAFPRFEYFLEKFEKALKFQGVDKAMGRDCANKASGREMRKWFELISKDPVMPIGLERKLTVTLTDNIVFTGKYDKVEWADKTQKAVRILDYKTGKPDDHLRKLEDSDDLASDDCDGYLRQLVSYKLLFERAPVESKGRKVTAGVLVFIEPVSKDLNRLGYKKGSYVSKSIEISNDLVNELEQIIIDMWNNIKKLQFEKLPSRSEDKCAICDFENICWG